MHGFRLSQKWIEAAVKREIGYGALQLKSLQDGCAGTYIRIIDSAVLSIVTESGAIDSKTVPEIMDLDTMRLVIAQREYEHIVDRAVLLVMVSQAIHNDKDVIPAKKQAFFSTMATFAENDDTLENIIECVSAVALHAGMTVSSKDKLILSISSAVNDKKHRVRQLM